MVQLNLQESSSDNKRDLRVYLNDGSTILKSGVEEFSFGFNYLFFYPDENHQASLIERTKIEFVEQRTNREFWEVKIPKGKKK